MGEPSSVGGYLDTVLGFLVGAVVSLIALVRKTDLGEIHRRLDRLEEEQERLRDKEAVRHLGEVP